MWVSRSSFETNSVGFFRFLGAGALGAGALGTGARGTAVAAAVTGCSSVISSASSVPFTQADIVCPSAAERLARVFRFHMRPPSHEATPA